MSLNKILDSTESEISMVYKLKYNIYLPKDYREFDSEVPLVLFLHGVGERGDNIDHVETHGIPKLIASGKKFPFITVAPQCPMYEWWSRSEMVKSLVLLIEKLKNEYRIDYNRVYVTGLSMGGFGTIAIVNERPDLFAAAIAVCGGADFSNYNRLKEVPIWLFHGEKDDVHPVEYSQIIYDGLKNINSEVKLTVYDGIDHNSWDLTYDNEDIYKWLLAKTN